MHYHRRRHGDILLIPHLREKSITDEQLRLDLAEIGPRAATGGRAKKHHEDRNLRTHPQTRVKLDGYRDYLPHYLGKLGNTSRRVFVNDLFAGSGRVRDGLNWADGSPLIACRAAQAAVRDFASAGRSVTFSLRFVELDEERRRTLDTLVDAFRAELDIKVYSGRAARHLDTILADSEGYPAITFLDPDGFGVTFDQVTAFARKYGEVLLDFDVQGLLRTASIAQTRAVTGFCGGDWWKEFSQDGVFNERGFLREYGRRISRPIFNYVSAQQLDFPEVVANRAIIQGAYSSKAIDLWRAAIERAMPRHGAVTFDFVPELDRRELVDGVIAAVRSLAGRRCSFSTIRGSLGILPAGQAEIHQALLFLRHEGSVNWTSNLHVESRPAPTFMISVVPDGLRWDGVMRVGEPPYRGPRAGMPVGARR